MLDEDNVMEEDQEEGDGLLEPEGETDDFSFGDDYYDDPDKDH